MDANEESVILVEPTKRSSRFSKCTMQTSPRNPLTPHRLRKGMNPPELNPPDEIPPEYLLNPPEGALLGLPLLWLAGKKKREIFFFVTIFGQPS